MANKQFDPEHDLKEMSYDQARKDRCFGIQWQPSMRGNDAMKTYFSSIDEIINTNDSRELESVLYHLSEAFRNTNNTDYLRRYRIFEDVKEICSILSDLVPDNPLFRDPDAFLIPPKYRKCDLLDIPQVQSAISL